MFLYSVWIGYLDADEDSLVDFLERHAGTLQNLTLHAVKLLKGSWILALPKAFRIDALTSVNPASSGEEHWCIDCHPRVGFYTIKKNAEPEARHSDQGIRTQRR